MTEHKHTDTYLQLVTELQTYDGKPVKVDEVIQMLRSITLPLLSHNVQAQVYDSSKISSIAAAILNSTEYRSSWDETSGPTFVGEGIYQRATELVEELRVLRGLAVEYAYYSPSQARKTVDVLKDIESRGYSIANIAFDTVKKVNATQEGE